MATKKMPSNSMLDIKRAEKFLRRPDGRRMPPKLRPLYNTAWAAVKALMAESESCNNLHDEIVNGD